MKRRRLTLRARLTMIYAAVLVLAAAGLLALTLVLVDRSLSVAYGASSLAQAQYRAQLEQALTTMDQAAVDGKPTPEEQKKRAALKADLLAANAVANGTAQTDTIDTLVVASLLALAVLVPAAAVGSWLLAGRVLRPVGAITDAARRASETRLDERLALAGPRDEITDLADTFDAMLERLEHAFDAQRRFVANASHELRTPLTVARTAIEVTLAKRDRRPEQLETMAADVHGALDRAERLVDSLLTLTRSQHLAHASEPVDLATASQDALDSLGDAIAERGLTAHAELHPTATAGDRALLERLVGNLLDNAVRHNHDGGWLSVRTDADGDQAAIVVGNSGPSVDPAGVPRLFEPFHRADGPARTNGSGLGLGLSIVRAVADAHRADVAVTARPDGGLLVAVRLPRVSARTDT